jgi:hypothetical protein
VLSQQREPVEEAIAVPFRSRCDDARLYTSSLDA